jgi:hypothetical protein
MMFGVEEWNAGVTTGVPQLLCPSELVKYWEGISLPSNGRVIDSDFRASGDPKDPATDYDLACSVAMLTQEAGLVPVADGHALVICGEIPFASWVPANGFSGGYVIVPEFWTDTEPNCKEILLTIDAEAYIETSIELVAGDQGFVLFAATDSANDSDFEHIKVDCPAGTYKVATSFYEAPDFQLRVIRMKPKFQSVHY